MKNLKIYLWILIFLISTSVYASEIGKILKYKGTVNVFRENHNKVLTVNKINFPLFLKDVVTTKSKSYAFISFIDKSKVFLKSKASLYIEGYRKFSLNKGRVIFKINKRGNLKGAQIRVKSVVIGVKGTKFLVDVNEGRTAIFLKEGLISVKNIQGKFKVFKKSNLEEFERFKQEIKTYIEEEEKEFDKFKKETEKEFAEFVKEFTLKPNMAAIIENNTVRYIKISDDIEKEFKEFESLDEKF